MSEPESELHDFNLDDAHLSDERRARIRARVRAELEAQGLDADAPMGPVAPGDPEWPVAPAGDPRRRRGRPLLAAAAALIAALGLGAAVVASSSDEDRQPVVVDDDRDQGYADTPADMAALVQVALAGPDVVLGEGDARYAHRVLATVTEVDGIEPSEVRVETWMAPDGSGRRLTTTVGTDIAPVDERLTEPGALEVAGLSYAELVALPTEPAALAAELAARSNVDPDDPVAISPALLDVLGSAAVPPRLRAAALRSLAGLGFEVVATAPTGDGLVTVATSGAEGPRVTARFSARTALLVSVEREELPGQVITTTYAAIDTRSTLDLP